MLEISMKLLTNNNITLVFLLAAYDILQYIVIAYA